MTTSYTPRAAVTPATRTKRTQPVTFLTLITGTYDDSLEYIITDWEWNAIFVYDNTWYPIISTIWNKRIAI